MPDPAFDIGEDITHQRKVWRIERIAWTLMGLAIVAALLGATGHGLFSTREVVTPGGLAVTYQRFERKQAQTQLSLRLPPDVGGQVRIRFGQDFLHRVEIARMEPVPERAELGADSTTYVFNADAAGAIQLHYMPLRPGALRLVIGLDGEAPLSLPLFVYP